MSRHVVAVTVRYVVEAEINVEVELVGVDGPEDVATEAITEVACTLFGLSPNRAGLKSLIHMVGDNSLDVVKTRLVGDDEVPEYSVVARPEGFKVTCGSAA